MVLVDLLDDEGHHPINDDLLEEEAVLVAALIENRTALRGLELEPQIRACWPSASSPVTPGEADWSRCMLMNQLSIVA